MYSQNFTQPSKKFVLSLHYSGENSYLFVNGKEELKFKAKTNQIIKKNLCLGNYLMIGQKMNLQKLLYMEIFTILL